MHRCCEIGKFDGVEDVLLLLVEVLGVDHLMVGGVAVHGVEVVVLNLQEAGIRLVEHVECDRKSVPTDHARTWTRLGRCFIIWVVGHCSWVPIKTRSAFHV